MAHPVPRPDKTLESLRLNDSYEPGFHPVCYVKSRATSEFADPDRGIKGNDSPERRYREGAIAVARLRLQTRGCRYPLPGLPFEEGS